MDSQAIERFILDDLLQGGSRQTIALDEPLVSSGVIDSLGMLKLIGFLEQEIGVAIGDGEVSPENFETMRKILEFIERKRGD
jgi:acyl carrier protein